MLQCVSLDVSQSAHFSVLKAQLSTEDCNRLYYLATGSELYIPICQGLSAAGLIQSRSKIVIENP